MKRLSLLLAASLALAASADPNYVQDLAQWRKVREEKLKAPDSWLAVAGLFWLHEGENKVGSDPLSDVVLPKTGPVHAGILNLHGKVAVWKPTTGPSATLDENSQPLAFGTVNLFLIVRGPKIGIRMKDPDADTRVHFTGLKWYDAKPEWHFQAKWTAYTPARTLRVPNVLGQVTDEVAPGYAEFIVNGKTYRLDPFIEDDHLFFIFKDPTSTSTTYGAGRFLYTPFAKDGTLDLDFNKAENPPCVFTAYATCPLPPKQNVLPLAIPAGELRYGKH